MADQEVAILGNLLREAMLCMRATSRVWARAVSNDERFYLVATEADYASLRKGVPLHLILDGPNEFGRSNDINGGVATIGTPLERDDCDLEIHSRGTSPDLLSEHIVRLQVQKFRSGQVIWARSLPLLRHLELIGADMTDSWDNPCMVAGENLLAGGAPRLRSVSLLNVSMRQIIPAFSNVRDLHLTQVPRRIEFTPSFGIRQLFPRLQDLVVESLDSWTGGDTVTGVNWTGLDGPQRIRSLELLGFFESGHADVPPSVITNMAAVKVVHGPSHEWFRDTTPYNDGPFLGTASAPTEGNQSPEATLALVWLASRHKVGPPLIAAHTCEAAVARGRPYRCKVALPRPDWIGGEFPLEMLWPSLRKHLVSITITIELFFQEAWRVAFEHVTELVLVIDSRFIRGPGRLSPSPPYASFPKLVRIVLQAACSLLALETPSVSAIVAPLTVFATKRRPQHGPLGLDLRGVQPCDDERWNCDGAFDVTVSEASGKPLAEHWTGERWFDPPF